MLSRASISAAVLVLAAAVRFPHFDVSWFGIDQVYFLAEARRILAGATDVVGPLSSGLNLLGPLYSYLLAGLLWLKNDAGFLGAFNAFCEVAGAWFVFDAGRRLAGTPAGVAAAVWYIASPVLVLSTRLIWNPSLLPMMVAVGWWMAVRYAERPSTGRLVGTALAAGLMLPLHPTGIFPALGVAIAVLLTRVPSVRQAVLAGIAGLLPVLPTLMRMSRSTGDINTLGAQLDVQPDFLATIPSVLSLLLAFPARLFGEDASAGPATVALYAAGLIALAGAVCVVVRHGPFRRVWIALVLSCTAYLAAASLYTGALTWYYLLALVPPMCLSGAGLIQGLAPRLQIGALVGAVVLAVPQLVFVSRFDQQAITSGLMRIDAQRVFLRRGPGEAFSLTMRQVRDISQSLAAHGLDGATALMSVHGILGELWRESGAEFMPWAAAPSAARTQGFTIVQGGRVCPSPAGPAMTWRAAHRATAGWESAAHAEEGWFALTLPHRTPGPSLAADDPKFSTWGTGRLVLRGRLTTSSPAERLLLGVTAHSPAMNGVALTELFVNGTPVSPLRNRVKYGIYRNEEWLIDLGGRLQGGENIIALGFAATQPVFDIDAFIVPCADGEWYY